MYQGWDKVEEKEITSEMIFVEGNSVLFFFKLMYSFQAKNFKSILLLHKLPDTLMLNIFFICHHLCKQTSSETHI